MDTVINHPKYGPLQLDERLEDVTFYKDEKGKIYQQILDGDIFKVKDGIPSFKTIKRRGEYSLKYNTNGVSGFCIFKGDKFLEDRIWSLKDAEKYFNEISNHFDDKIMNAACRKSEQNKNDSFSKESLEH